MRAMILAATVLLYACQASAQSAIRLEPFPGESTLDVVTTANYTGKCAGSVVRVMGVTGTIANAFSRELDAGKIIVRDGPRHMIEIELQDFSGVACADTPTGKKLLVWGNCGGSACGDAMNFEVYDPKALVRLTPDPMKKVCDAACASKVLGTNLPFEIDAR